MSTEITFSDYYKNNKIKLQASDWGLGGDKDWTYFDEEGNKIKSTEEVCLSIVDDCDYHNERCYYNGLSLYEDIYVKGTKICSIDFWNILQLCKDDTKMKDIDACIKVSAPK